MIELSSATQQLTIPERERRMTVGRELGYYLSHRGFKQVVFVTNIQDALPVLTRDELKRHAVPTDAYAGRGPGMALGLQFPDQEMVVHLPTPMFPQEESLLRDVATRTNVVFPTLRSDVTAVLQDERTFVYPFIGSAEMNEKFPNRTTPAAGRFNNKALMRQRFKDSGMTEKLVPGAEIFYQGQEPPVFIQQVIDTVREYATSSSQERFMLKLAETASGLLSPTITSEEIRELKEGRIPDSLQSKVAAMFTGNDGTMFMGDVVLEEFVPYKSDGHTGDFNTRGYLLPDGQFIPLSVGRQICDEKGQYLGMISVPSHNQALVQQIGLHPNVLVIQMEIMEKIARSMFKDGYFGPVSFDCFCGDGPDAVPANRDFNQREGGGTVPGIIAANSGAIYGEERAVMDVETKIESSRRLEGREIEALLERLSTQGVSFYATTFMRSPSNGGNSHIYTLKTVQPFNGIATNELSMAQSIVGNVAQLNASIGQSMGLNFRVAY